MAYQMVQLPMTFSNTHNSGNTACFNYSTVCLHINWNVHAACDSNFVTKGEGLLKVTGSHVHWNVVISRKQC